MRFIDTVDLDKLNSMTRYPSIPTYHTMDQGILSEPCVDFGREIVYFSEKVDGTNARIILLPFGDYLIGSRTELLYYRGDVVHNSSQGIVDAIKSFAERWVSINPNGAGIVRVIYAEVFGGKIGNRKQYTSAGATSFRVFDVFDILDYKEILEKPIEQISTWREGGQSAWNVSCLKNFKLPIVPYLSEIPAQELPTSLQDTHAFLRGLISTTHCRLDDGGIGRPEGVVGRTADRKVIAKFRFEDYEYTFRKQSNG